MAKFGKSLGVVWWAVILFNFFLMSSVIGAQVNNIKQEIESNFDRCFDVYYQDNHIEGEKIKNQLLGIEGLKFSRDILCDQKGKKQEDLDEAIAFWVGRDGASYKDLNCIHKVTSSFWLFSQESFHINWLKLLEIITKDNSLLVPQNANNVDDEKVELCNKFQELQKKNMGWPPTTFLRYNNLQNTIDLLENKGDVNTIAVFTPNILKFQKDILSLSAQCKMKIINNLEALNPNANTIPPKIIENKVSNSKEHIITISPVKKENEGKGFMEKPDWKTFVIGTTIVAGILVIIKKVINKSKKQYNKLQKKKAIKQKPIDMIVQD